MDKILFDGKELDFCHFYNTRVRLDFDKGVYYFDTNGAIYADCEQSLQQAIDKVNKTFCITGVPHVTIESPQYSFKSEFHSIAMNVERRESLTGMIDSFVVNFNLCMIQVK
jgi:hypothetical protein